MYANSLIIKYSLFIKFKKEYLCLLLNKKPFIDIIILTDQNSLSQYKEDCVEYLVIVKTLFKTH